MQYTISLGRNVCTNTITEKTYETFNDFLQFFLKPSRLTIQEPSFHASTKGERVAIKESLPYFCGATFTEQHRNSNFFKSSSFLILDIDKATKDWQAEILYKLIPLDIQFILSSSISHSPRNDLFKFHLIIPTSPISDPSLYAPALSAFLEQSGINPNLLDNNASKNPICAILSPAIFTNNEEYICEYIDTPNTFIPHLSKPSQTVPYTKRLKTLPSHLSGAIGVFNSLMTAKEALLQFAPANTYVEGEHGRYSHVGSTTTNGITFYENDQFLQSFHSTDPLSSKSCWSAFDLFAHFVHNDNSDKAETALYDIPAISTAMSNTYSDLLSQDPDIKEHAHQFLPIPHHLFISLKESMTAEKALTFLRKYVCKSIESSKLTIFFAIEREESEGKREIEYFSLKPSDARIYFSNMAMMQHPHAPDKAIHPLEYYLNFDVQAKALTGRYFDPSTIYSKWADKLNTFTGFPFSMSLDYREPTFFIEYVNSMLANGDKALGSWVLDWCADIFQNPHVKKGTALVLYSPEKGSGKSALFDLILRPLLTRYASIVSGSVLKKEFNGYIQNKLLCCFDDIKKGSDEAAAKLRTMITSEHVAIERKGENIVDAVDYTRYMLTSNFKDICAINSAYGERRFTVLQVSPHNKDNYFFWNDFVSQCNTNLRNIFTYLMKRRITANLRTAYLTPLYHTLVSEATNSVEHALSEIFGESLEHFVKAISAQFFGLSAQIKGSWVYVEKSRFIDYLRTLSNDTRFDNRTIIKLLKESLLYVKQQLLIDDTRSKRVRITVDKESKAAVAISIEAFTSADTLIALDTPFTSPEWVKVSTNADSNLH